MARVEEWTDVIVVGAGHAGCEAALSCARLGLSTVIFTVSADSIAMMPCNPHIAWWRDGKVYRSYISAVKDAEPIKGSCRPLTQGAG